MPQAMHTAETGADGLAFIDAQLIDVVTARWNEGTSADQRMRPIEHRALLGGANRDLACLATFGPTGFQDQTVALIGNGGDSS